MKASYWVFLLIGACNAINVNAQKIKGSDTVLPLSQQAAENFMNKNPQARVTVTGGGSGVGISALLDNTTDIAMLREPLSSVRK
ncbi:phosphate ABC transporter, periplasmic phosphate-binding protein PstS [Bacteroides graminisolvens DSM 19988 = JCM 15093]|uniref:Phosphate ABC transporter, periplasmic phosphate-binding protein PstS n=1 Tax=Bacteroides graminisolvens DSM 19988 = JCM 15093 TaxID=1121097 RepID=A0A069D2P7_9BACE|nr:phosphate ABC transporter, periplasmic phosphate-binding protein PstS [Bacteroides graminisolvens DSM 19988 = JCM 15093]